MPIIDTHIHAHLPDVFADPPNLGLPHPEPRRNCWSALPHQPTVQALATMDQLIGNRDAAGSDEVVDVWLLLGKSGDLRTEEFLFRRLASRLRRRTRRPFAMKLRTIVLLSTIAAVVHAAPAPSPDTYVPPQFEPPPISIPGATRYTYKQAGTFELPIYVFAPPAGVARPAPAIVFFHGSGWQSGTVTQFIAHAKHLAQLGLVAALAEYRIKVGYDATPFDGVADAKSAVRWLRAHAIELNLDPHRVAVAGGSAGAHLALCTAVFDGEFDDPADDINISARPDLIFLFAAVTDTTKSENESRPNPLFLGREREISPIHHLRRGLPPVQIFQGMDDPWATIDRARAFADAVEANGDECDLIAFAGRTHFFYNHPSYYTRYPVFAPNRSTNDYDLCLLLMTRFLRGHHFLATRPIVPAVDSTVPSEP